MRVRCSAAREAAHIYHLQDVGVLSVISRAAVRGAHHRRCSCVVKLAALRARTVSKPVLHRRHCTVDRHCRIAGQAARRIRRGNDRWAHATTATHHAGLRRVAPWSFGPPARYVPGQRKCARSRLRAAAVRTQQQSATAVATRVSSGVARRTRPHVREGGTTKPRRAALRQLRRAQRDGAEAQPNAPFRPGKNTRFVGRLL
jgi:hypothetical protein